MNVYRILHFLSNVCFDKVVWAPAPVVIFFFFLIPPSLLLQICIWSIQETMWKSVLTSQTDKTRHMTAEHMAQRGILIWPTQTVFPEIHIWETPPAAKAKNKESTRQKEQYAT